jgi:mRNA interferase YafQ
MTKAILKENGFIRDAKLCARRGYDFAKLEEIILILADGKPLPARCRPHKLSGDYAHCWECHILPDWLLVYRISDDELTIVRTGTHADLF